MAKDKKGSKVANAPKASNPVEAVKTGRVTKDSKKSSKEVAKKTAEKVSKKSKKKEPTPEPSSDEEEDDDDTSDESDSSEEEEVAAPKTNGAAKANGSAKAGAKDSSDSSDDDSSEDEAPAAKTNGHANGKVNGSAKAAAEDDSDDSDDSSDDDDEDVPAATKAAVDDDSDDSEDDDEDDSSDDDENEEEEKPAAAASKKRKADTEVEPAAKKAKVTKIEINGELKDPSANLFVGGISWNVDEDWLTREFEEFGELVGVRIITDRETGKSKGFGYVEFADVANAITALQAKNETELDGRALRMDFSSPRQPNGQTPQQRGADRAAKYGDSTNPPAATLFVGNLSFDADEATVTEHFSQYGTIMGVRLPTDRETGAPKGFGYVEMSSIDEAKAALEGLAGADIGGRAVRLDYSGPRPDNGGGRGGFGDRGGRGGGRGFGGGRGGRGGFGDRGGRGGGRGRGGFGDRGGRGGGRGGSTNRGGFGDFSGKKVTF